MWHRSLQSLRRFSRVHSGTARLCGKRPVFTALTLVACSAWGAWTVPCNAQPSPGMQDLGTLCEPFSQAYGVSAFGSVVVGGSRNTGQGTGQNDPGQDPGQGTGPNLLPNSCGFRWTAVEGMQEVLNTLGGDSTVAYGVSADSSIVVGSASNAADQFRAFRWTFAGGMQEIPNTLGGNFSCAYGVSADGSVVVGYARNAANWNRAFRWTFAEGMQDLGTLGGTSSYARGVSAAGSVVVGYARNAANQLRAFRWTFAGGMQEISNTLGGNSSYAYGVSADGSVVVGFASNAADEDRAFRWTAAGGMQEIPNTLGGNFSYAYGVSGDGAVVVGAAVNATDDERAFRAVVCRPRVTVSPQSRTVAIGQPTTFSVTAVGSPIDGPLRYQWRKDGVRIAGANDATYTIAAVDAFSAGLYDVVVRNSCGQVRTPYAALNRSFPSFATVYSSEVDVGTATINWVTDRPVQGAVRWGASLDALSNLTTFSSELSTIGSRTLTSVSGVLFYEVVVRESSEGPEFSSGVRQLVIPVAASTVALNVSISNVGWGTAQFACGGGGSPTRSLGLRLTIRNGGIPIGNQLASPSVSANIAAEGSDISYALNPPGVLSCSSQSPFNINPLGTGGISQTDHTIVDAERYLSPNNGFGIFTGGVFVPRPQGGYQIYSLPSKRFALPN